MKIKSNFTKVIANVDVADILGRNAIIKNKAYEVIKLTEHGDVVVKGNFGDPITLCVSTLGMESEFEPVMDNI